MQITADGMRLSKKSLEDKREELVAQLNMVNGGIQVLDQLLSIADMPESEPDAEQEAAPSNVIPFPDKPAE